MLNRLSDWPMITWLTLFFFLALWRSGKSVVSFRPQEYTHMWKRLDRLTAQTILCKVMINFREIANVRLQKRNQKCSLFWWLWKWLTGTTELPALESPSGVAVGRAAGSGWAWRGAETEFPGRKTFVLTVVSACILVAVSLLMWHPHSGNLLFTPWSLGLYFQWNVLDISVYNSSSRT